MCRFLLLITIYMLIEISCAENNNTLINDPLVKCADHHFEITFSTSSPFHGIAFVHGYLTDPHCRSHIKQSSNSLKTTLKLPFDRCGIASNITSRNNGVFVRTSFILAFNPDFLTKHDKYFNIECYYKETNRYLQREVKVNMRPAVLHSKQVPMPVCKYEVLDGSPFGPPVFYAKVGQPVYHKWSCESEEKNTFCMTVHSCYADNGKSERVPLLNQDGCAMDKYLLTNLEYPEDLMAGREAHVYKYADQDHIMFDCQISVRLKPLYAEYCDVPTCPDPPRRRRSDTANGNATNELLTFNVTENVNLSEQNSTVETLNSPWFNERFNELENNLCFEQPELTGLLTINVLLIVASAAIVCNAWITYHDKS